MMLRDGHRPETITMSLSGDGPGDVYKTINYDLCRAVDRLKLPGILERMVALGMPKEQAELFDAMSSSLLQLMRTENNRLYAAALKSTAATEKTDV